MEKEDNELLLEQILSIIEENNKKIESQDSEELLKQMVWEGLLFLESKAGTMSNELTELYKTYKEYLKLSKNINKNVLYKYELQIRVNVIQKMIEEGYDETKLQLIRAKYNLKIINQLFIILNFMINEDDYRKNISKRLYDPQINQNINIYKLNMSLFMINLIYEKTRDKIDAILIQPESKTETLIEDLLKEYNGDSQTLGEVLSSRYKDVRNSSEHNQYRIMREYLIEQGFDTTKTPIFKFLRNSSSHGEFYPIIRDNNDIDIKIDNDGKEKQVISLQTLITLVDSKLSTLPSAEEYQIFIDFYKSTDILETMEKYKKEGKTTGVIKMLAILFMYNIVQYNTEQLFSELKTGKRSQIRKVDNLNIRKYFTFSGTSEDKNYKILETIKHAIGHMNIEYENGNITFENRKYNQSCTASIINIFAFALKSGIYGTVTATTFYQYYIEEVKRITSYINDINIEEVKRINSYINDINIEKGNYNKIEIDKNDIYYNNNYNNKKYY